LLVLAVGAGCQCAPDESPPVLARVGERDIGVADLEREMARRAEDGGASFATAEQRRALLDDLIRREVLAQNARRAVYQEHPEVVATLERALVAQFQQDQVEKRLADLGVSDARSSRTTASIWTPTPARSAYTPP
jgi:hypothetical protein